MPSTDLPAICLALALGAAIFSAPEASANKIAKGERVEFKGIVTDADGKPIQQVTVNLNAIRRKFRARRFRKETVDTFRVSAVTNERGEYSIYWPWNDYYNCFELVVVTSVRHEAGDDSLELERVDITKQASSGSPVLSSLVVQDTSYLYKLRRFRTTVDTSDEKRIYGELGAPDRFEEVTDSDEVTWWYFKSGKVYRFIGGKLKDIVPFDPVKEF